MKYRQYTITIHNVLKERQDKIERHVKKQAKEMVMSIEPYPNEDGYHLHVFIQYANQRSFKSVLKEYEALATKIVAPVPEGETRSWGRVQVDVMRGRFDQATAYLKGDTKDKPTGEVISLQKKPCNRVKLYTKRIGDKNNMIEICGLCRSATCPGCCAGCYVCDEEIRRAEDRRWWNDMCDTCQLPPEFKFAEVSPPEKKSPGHI